MTGESITEASRRAIEERLSRVRARTAVNDHGEDLMEFIRRARRPELDERSLDELIGYDQGGTWPG